MRAALHTLGCKLNQAETSAIGARLRARGLDLGALADGGDLIVINSCTVTHTAEAECRKLVRRALRRNPDAYVVVTGCYAQLRPEEVASIEGVDLVVGTADKLRLADLLEFPLRKRDVPLVLVREVDHRFGPAATDPATGRVRAFLKVQDGCDYRCSYCTIPRARGPSRSLALEEAIAQARGLVERGAREVVLTGVNVGAWRDEAGRRLADLVEALCGIAGLARLRISSIEPNLLSDAIVEQVGRSGPLAPHFHVPLQSGSDAVLARMRRRYRAADYAARVRALVEAVPACAVGADVIVGFPGETDDEFQETFALIASLPLAYLHVFTYSERPGTPARALGAPVPPPVRKRRMAALRRLDATLRRRFAGRFAGTVRPVLWEQHADDTLWGWTDNYLRVHRRGRPEEVGRLEQVRLVSSDGGALLAEPPSRSVRA